MSVILAAVGAVALTTILLTLGFAVAAQAQGYGVIEYYAQIFPTYRGGNHADVPRAVYVVHVVYLLTTAQLSLFLRGWRRNAAKRSAASPGS